MSKAIKYKFRSKSFSGYGLDKEKNFLQAPICECGCGNKCHIMLDDAKELFSFMNTMLMEHECNHCAIFAHAYDDYMYAAIKCIHEDDSLDDSDETTVKFFGTEDDYHDFFKEWDDEAEFHCYGLLIETRKGEWDIIED